MPSSLDLIFRPRAVAVIGASTQTDCVGRQIFTNLRSYGFPGPVYPVNPKVAAIEGVPCFPSIEVIEGPVELAVIVVPRAAVLSVVEQCARKDVRGLVVISAGFRELSSEGAALEEELKAAVRRHGMRLIGPNCMGVFHTDPNVRMNATFAPAPPQPGSIGFISQSGALGAAVLSTADQLDLGFSFFASIGNEADVTASDLLAYWQDDPRTDVVLVYLESLPDPAGFRAVAEQISRKKPLVVLKGGCSEAGARAAASHTGALAGADEAVDAFLRQCGALRVGSMEEMMEVATGFSRGRVPRGRHVALLTNAGGPGILATDACSAQGLEFPQLAETTLSSLREIAPPQAAIANPTDLTVAATAAMYEGAARAMLADPAVDSLLAVFVTPMMVAAKDVFPALERAALGSEKPVFSVFTAQENLRLFRPTTGAKLPVFIYPEAAARALGAMTRFLERRNRTVGHVRGFVVNQSAARRILERAATEGREHLRTSESLEVLEAYGLACARWERVPVQSANDALAAASRLGYPIAMKLDALAAVHKTEKEAVILAIADDRACERAYDRLVAQLDALGQAPADAILVQKMLTAGTEVILGLTRKAFAPLVMFGLGGIFVEVLRDVAFRALPVTDIDATEMVREIRGYPLLAGARSRPPLAVGAVEEALLRLAQLGNDFPAIRELDVNPFWLAERAEDSKVVDARIRIEPSGLVRG